MTNHRRPKDKPLDPPAAPPRPAPIRRQKVFLGVAIIAMTAWLIILAILAAK